MKNHHTATRIIAGVLPAMALFATPALAQEAVQPAPPATAPAPQPVPPAAAPIVVAPAPAAAPSATGPSDADRAKVEASATAATGTAAAPSEAAPAERATRPAARVSRTTTTRTGMSRPAAAAPAPAPVAAEPATPPATQPVAPAPEAAAPAADQAPVTTDATTTTTADAQTTTDTPATAASGVPSWAWMVGGLAVIGLALLAFFGLRRRREEPVWQDEPAAYEPVIERPVAEPAAVAAAPLAAEPVAEHIPEHAEVVAPAQDEVAAITEASEPVAGRPWIELSLRPLRAGATDDAALVDLELTLANAGEVAARNVRVSAFMLGDAAEESQMDRLLAHGHDRTEVDAGEIGAGEGSRVDATLTTPREGLEGATFQPIVVADVRYTLPNGSEGRTAAAFAIGADDGTEEPTPLRLGGDMREDVSATLHGVLERA